ncbi:MAG: hypothetical protein A2087_14730 [Spirochaetes bacterium GWD1_61_31]|nr:MAG: hypothetical protein A2Y37_12925 [Spirochaetes bacterium GWB1_60_80]OHD28686.1 MAG: hypothetical protein A2004_05875 [Spirochaetes bacterium GWC1_61_12]OHD38892.1 MAG: hypothetical protein A2087_14730 [Spirochaetes bacterium GWD1_61_31]OHD43329.1 MAG: hypothetical protein A2Y35_08620 [Spirochaetes bacterium GWE1_60_18]OHD58867.1 MAG: hypothetical protein A2Y32_08990 [Spirochaetes bacterium GWF1_60_12]
MSSKESAQCFAELPEVIRTQIDALIPASGLAGLPLDEARARFARVWEDKYQMFCGQIHNLGMAMIEELSADDYRGAIVLTYSGSLISLGTVQTAGRWLEYASVKFRSDVPDLVQSSAVSLVGPLRQDAVAGFSGSTLKHSSLIYRIAACPPGTPDVDQEQRIREATIFLTNAFVKLNRGISLAMDTGLDQFTLKSIVSYLAKKNGLTQVQTRAVLDDYLATVESGLLLGEKVNLGRLGSLSLKPQAARKARVMKNPQTGEEVLVPAKAACLVPKMSFAQAFKAKAGQLDPALVAGAASGDDEAGEAD